MSSDNKNRLEFGVRIADGEKESYIYLAGIKPSKPILLGEDVSLIPASCSPTPDDMIDAVMKKGSQSEFELGILIATLRNTTAQIKIEDTNSRNLAIKTWNAQTFCVLISAILKCEISYYFQADTSLEKFNGNSNINMIYPNMYKFPNCIKYLDDNMCSWIEKSIMTAWELHEDERFSTASHALWSYKWSVRPALQLSIVWSGIESMFLIETKIRTRLSKAISRFLYNNDTAVEDIKKLYAFRSKAVHEYKNSEHNVLEESVDILNKLILKCIEQKALPDLGILLNSTD